MKAMSAYMTGELLLFARAFWNGALLLLIYDVIRILRGVVSHGKILTAAEDLLFWIFSAFWLLGYFYGKTAAFSGDISLRAFCWEPWPAISASAVFLSDGGRKS